MPVVTYRISRFGTVLLTPEQQESSYLTVRVSSVITRAVEYKNFNWLPPQINWLVGVGIDADGYIISTMYAQWYRQKFILRDNGFPVVQEALCVAANGIYVDVMTELAKKPNIPPLPPSTPPLGQPFSLAERVEVRPYTALLFKSLNDGDFDVTIGWADPFPFGQCRPNSRPEEPPGPISSLLPPPTPFMPAPPPLNANQPGVLPTGSPAVGGTSLVPPGFSPGLQSEPPVPLKTRVFVRGEFVNPCNLGCGAARHIEVQVFDFPGISQDPWTATLNSGAGVCPGSSSGYSIRKNGVVQQTQVASIYAVSIQNVFLVDENSPTPPSTVESSPCQS